jgi:hypothetical protein
MTSPVITPTATNATRAGKKAQEGCENPSGQEAPPDVLVFGVVNWTLRGYRCYHCPLLSRSSAASRALLSLRLAA